MFEAEAKKRQVEAGKQFGENHPKQEVVQKIEQPLENTNSNKSISQAVESLPLFEAEAKKRQVAAGGDKKSESARQNIDKSVNQKIDEPILEKPKQINIPSRRVFWHQPAGLTQEAIGEAINLTTRQVRTILKAEEKPQDCEKIDTQLTRAKQNKVHRDTQRKIDKIQKDATVVQKIEQRVDDTNSNKSISQAAEFFGTNRQYVADAKKLKEEDPASYKAVLSGEKTIDVCGLC